MKTKYNVHIFCHECQHGYTEDFSNKKDAAEYCKEMDSLMVDCRIEKLTPSR